MNNQEDVLKRFRDEQKALDENIKSEMHPDDVAEVEKQIADYHTELRIWREKKKLVKELIINLSKQLDVIDGNIEHYEDAIEMAWVNH